MNNKQSLTITSLFIFVAVWLFQQANIEIGEGEIQTFIEVLIKIVSLVGIWWGRLRAGGVSVLGRKR